MLDTAATVSGRSQVLMSSATLDERVLVMDVLHTEHDVDSDELAVELS